MTTLTLKDSGPTTTITFDTFKVIDWRMDAKYFHAQAIPKNQGTVIVHEEAWLETLKIDYQLKHDSSWPSSGNSCSDKWLAFRELLKTGGDKDSEFQLTFDLEDSTPSVSSTITLTGKVKNMKKRFVAGKNNVYIEGDFEFYLGER